MPQQTITCFCLHFDVKRNCEECEKGALPIEETQNLLLLLSFKSRASFSVTGSGKTDTLFSNKQPTPEVDGESVRGKKVFPKERP